MCSELLVHDVDVRQSVRGVPEGIRHRADDLESHRRPQSYRPLVRSDDRVELHSVIPMACSFFEYVQSEESPDSAAAL